MILMMMDPGSQVYFGNIEFEYEDEDEEYDDKAIKERSHRITKRIGSRRVYFRAKA